LDNGDCGFTPLKDDRAGVEITLRPGRRIARPNASRDRQEGVGSDDRLANANLEFRMCERVQRTGEDKDDERQNLVSAHGTSWVKEKSNVIDESFDGRRRLYLACLASERV
jgi:hypothetical protein